VKAQIRLAWLVLACPAVQGQAPQTPLLAVPRAGLWVTEGELAELPNGALVVSVPKMRAYVNGPTADVAELRFTSTACSARSLRRT
jgi:hypothetical protein